MILAGVHGEACATCDAPRWRVLLHRANAARRCGATCKRTRQPCRSPAMSNGRCRMHGGPSTGARTPEGQAQCRVAPRKHGGRDAAARARAAQRRAARRLSLLLETMAAEARAGSGR